MASTRESVKRDGILHPRGQLSGQSPERSRHSASSSDRTRLQVRLGSLEKEIASVDVSIAELQSVRDALIQEQLELQQRLNSSINSRLGPLRQMGSAPNGYASTPEQAHIDYSGDFEWDKAMKCKMTEIFGIHSFRLCQKG